MESTEVRAALVRATETLHLPLGAHQLSGLQGYLELLLKWNRVYNLTAVRQPADMLTHHLLDSLAVVAPLRRQLASAQLPDNASLLDVGSGAGLPGLVVAICCPGLSVTCIDAVAKKTAFVQQAATALGLANVRAVHGRIETVATPHDVICSRAFASLADFTAWSEGALAPNGMWMAMKAHLSPQERAAVDARVEVFHVEHLSVPGLDAERCIVWMRKKPVAPGIGVDKAS